MRCAMNRLLHWRKVRVVRRAAAWFPERDIRWAVITRHHVDPDVPGWDYHLIPAEWGYEAATQRVAELGGWILTL
jgi:hypothetical protein